MFMTGAYDIRSCDLDMTRGVQWATYAIRGSSDSFLGCVCVCVRSLVRYCDLSITHEVWEVFQAIWYSSDSISWWHSKYVRMAKIYAEYVFRHFSLHQNKFQKFLKIWMIPPS